MRTGPSHQAGSDSLLTASTFFKMREIYFQDHIDDTEYSGKLYGLGQTFSVPNGLTDPARGGATIAEREDRGSSREVHNSTPGPNAGQQQNLGMSLVPMQPGLPSMNSSYGSLNTVTPGNYMRTSIVGGGR